MLRFVGLLLCIQIIGHCLLQYIFIPRCAAAIDHIRAFFSQICLIVGDRRSQCLCIVAVLCHSIRTERLLCKGEEILHIRTNLFLIQRLYLHILCRHCESRRLTPRIGKLYRIRLHIPVQKCLPFFPGCRDRNLVSRMHKCRHILCTIDIAVPDRHCIFLLYFCL